MTRLAPDAKPCHKGMMQTALLIFVGGGLGSVLRWLTGLLALRLFGSGFPLGTLAVNLIGCFLMGLLARILIMGPQPIDPARALLMTGLLGGYTTFSAFALDAAQLWMRDTGGLALGYILLTVLGSLGAVALGLWLGAFWTRG
jgi:CrcB protein